MNDTLRRDFLDAPDEGRDAVNLVDTIVFALFRSKYVFVALTFVGFALGLGYGVVTPNRYESTGLLLVRGGARESATPDTALTDSTRSVSSREVVSNEIHILTSREVYEAVARDLGADKVLAPVDPAAQDTADTPLTTRILHSLQSWWMGDTEIDAVIPLEQAAVDALMRTVDVHVLPGSSVLEIVAQAQTPELAREIVDATLQAALERHGEVFSTDLYDLIGKRRDRLAKELERATRELNEFRQKHDVYDLDVQRTALLAERNELRRQITAADRSKAEYEARLKQAKLDLEETQPLIEREGRGVQQPNTLHQTLQQRLIEAEAALADIRANPIGSLSAQQNREATQQKLIDAWTERLKTVPPYLTLEGADVVFPSTRHARLQDRVDELRDLLIGIESTSAGDAKRMEALDARLEELDDAEAEYRQLLAAANDARDSAAVVAEQEERASLLKMLDDVKQSNLTVVQKADLVLDKVGPRRFRSLAIGTIFGLLAAGMLALVRVAIDSRVVRRADVERLPGCGVLAVIPQIQRLRRAEEPSLLNELDTLPKSADRIWVELASRRREQPQVRVAFVASSAASGTSTIAAFAAVRLAENLGERVLLIESQPGETSLSEVFSLPEGPGISDLCSGDAGVDQVVQDTGIEGLRVLPAGHGVTAGALASAELQASLREAAGDATFVIVDAPPHAPNPEVELALAKHDWVIPVFRAGGTMAADARALCHMIAEAGIATPGAVLNGYESPMPFWVPDPDRK